MNNAMMKLKRMIKMLEEIKKRTGKVMTIVYINVIKEES
jgi:hypothetical protein